ncbi:hypothetical protein KBY84_15625 [Cyanobium sp. N.Huapi 1H5]|uniref:hypothetical protein n=1 Tax=Cyanobium sp. N.Huapi 1H5 TaxID=2823719 RepID=UPI0020CC5B1E|nr:hypothetical protein [Cyanobium sp. N.Huapi 1H5]MCP9838930.1 hypothetical protein [Cyanobium sp. N.Huapi 1H5]
MLPTLAERLREQHAKTRGRRPTRPPWPVPGEPPTALLFQVRPELEPAAVPVGPDAPAAAAVADPDPLPRVSAVVVTEIARPEPLEPEVAEPQRGVPELTQPALAVTLPPEPAVAVEPITVPERTALAELLLLLVWAVLVLIDGALALVTLIDGAAGRQGRPQASAADAPPSKAPAFLMAAAAP